MRTPACVLAAVTAGNSWAWGLELTLGLPAGLRRALLVTRVYERKQKFGSFR